MLICKVLPVQKAFYACDVSIRVFFVEKTKVRIVLTRIGNVRKKLFCVAMGICKIPMDSAWLLL